MRVVRAEARTRWSRRGLLMMGGSAWAASSCLRSGPAAKGLWLGGDVHLGAVAMPANPFLAQLPGSGVVNLEGPIAPGPGSSFEDEGRSVRLRNGGFAPTWLRGSGVIAASVLNNHQFDAGVPAWIETQRALRADGIAVLADAVPWAGRSHGQRLMVFSSYLQERTQRGSRSADLDKMVQAQSQGAFVVAYVHVDAPPSYLASPWLRDQVELLLRTGAHVVALHGTHLLGPVERRGEQLIAWGLGNLHFACPCSREREGLILGLGPRWKGPARLYPVNGGQDTEPAKPPAEPNATFDLLESLGSSPLRRHGGWAQV